MENKIFYTLEMASGSGKIDKSFTTYREAYDFMCKNYCRELAEGYTPTLYKIIRTSRSIYNGNINTMVQPVWSE